MMRQSGTSVEMFQLRALVDSVAAGELALPDFQREFDWSETDVRALLVTVFSGWPAGSLLLLDARGSIFRLRPFDAGPALHLEPAYAVLDGQQRLTSLYQALFGAGENVFAVKWEDASDDIEESVVSFKASVWARRFSRLDQQAHHKLIPVSVLKTASTFFAWRDELLANVDPAHAPAIRNSLTALYSSRLSRLNEYEFPAVKLDRKLDPSAIARIFERVNKHGLKLSAFDLMVAKTYGPDWNLRDDWIRVREVYPALSVFLDEDGMPLLQAISLRLKNDLRQSAVLQLSRDEVRALWNQAAEACATVVAFLKEECGAVRREFMPYPNTIAPLVALEMDRLVSHRRADIKRWFWFTAFSGSFDAAANTRLAAHYRVLSEGGIPEADAEAKRVDLRSVTRKTDKAFWLGVLCALTTEVYRVRPGELTDYVVDELEAGTLYSPNEIGGDDERTTYRSVLNTIVVPGKHAPITAKLAAEDTVAYAHRIGFGDLVAAQLPDRVDLQRWMTFSAERAEWLTEFINRNSLHPRSIVFIAEEAAP